MNNRGFTMLEVLISCAITMILILAIFTAVQFFNKQNIKETRTISSRVLLAQSIGSIVANPDQYPPYNYNSAEGSYVLCFSKELAQIDYSATSTVEFIQTSALGSGVTPRQCTTPYEVRVRPITNATGAVRWFVVVTMIDPNTGSAIDKANATFANAGGI